MSAATRKVSNRRLRQGRWATILLVGLCVPSPLDAQEVDAGVESTAERRLKELEALPAESTPELRVELEPRGRISVGEALSVMIHATVQDGDDVAIPQQELAPFERLDSQRTVFEAEKGRRTFRLEIRLLALEAGRHSVGPIELRIVTHDGVLGSASTEPLEIEVASWIANEPNAELKAPSNPVLVEEDDYTLAWIAAAVLVLATTVLLTLWVARRWRQRRIAETPPPPPRPADEIAREELDALRAQLSGMLGRGKGSDWTDSLSDVVRRLLGRRFGFDGLESTTDETLEHLRRDCPVPSEREQAAAFLQECDLIKFAKVSIGLNQAEALLDAAYELVDQAVAKASPAPIETAGDAQAGGS